MKLNVKKDILSDTIEEPKIHKYYYYLCDFNLLKSKIVIRRVQENQQKSKGAEI
jgi:hypothetical protein